MSYLFVGSHKGDNSKVKSYPTGNGNMLHDLTSRGQFKMAD